MPYIILPSFDVHELQKTFYATSETASLYVKQQDEISLPNPDEALDFLAKLWEAICNAVAALNIFAHLARAIEFLGALAQEYGPVLIEAVKEFAMMTEEHVIEVLILVDAHLREDPRFYFWLSTFIVVGPWLLLPVMLAFDVAFRLALGVIGFGVGGVIAGSPAAACHASIQLVEAGSLFSTFQHLGAVGFGAGAAYNAVSFFCWPILVIRIFALAVAVYIWFWIFSTYGDCISSVF